MNKNSPFKLLILFLLFSSLYSNSQTTLTHNICNDVIKTINHACSGGGAYFGRAFELNDFGINNTEEFTITHGEVALTYAEGSPRLRFYIYKIDTNFPNSFDENDLIGQSQIVNLPSIWSQGLQDAHIITIAFENPIVVPADVERILVSVKQESPNWGSGLIHLAGTLEDNDFSYYKNCVAGPDYINTDDLNYNNSTYPGSDYNFYIKAIEDFTNINAPFRIYQENDCYGLTKNFNLTSTITSAIININWDFGDPTSGANNSSTQVNPSHIYSSEGTYTVTATITTYANETYIITKTITVTEEGGQPIIVDDIFACEDTFGSGISSSFDTSNIETQILNGQTGMIVSYFDQNGNELPSPLPNPLTNTQANSQEIIVRIKDSNRLCCFNETTFNVITNPLPDTSQTNDIISCDNDGDGFAAFDISNIPIDLVNGQSNLTVELLDSNNNSIPTTSYNNFVNITDNQDFIKAIITNPSTNCSSETNINLIVNDNPVVNQLQTILGCDDNNDGVSEYFDTSNIENQVLNGQTGMTISYFDQNGNELNSPLLNPYTNSNPFSEVITVRVTDNNSSCYTETTLQLQTATQPNINQPDNIYACDQGNGYAEFDTSNIEQQLIGNQTGLSIQYYDANNNTLPSPLPLLFQNTEPFSQSIIIRIEDTANPICYSETSFDLIVNDLPEINLDIDDILLCDNDEDGFTAFDISNIPIDLVNGQSNFTVELFDSNNNLIPTANYNSFVNLTANQDYIKAIITNPSTNCSSETNINLIVNDNPVVNQLQTILGCDDNNDGISEYFDTSNIENQALNGQTGMTISYFDQNGNELNSPLLNPYTNSNPFSEVITVRVTNNSSSCYTETTLQLQTVSQPSINQPDNLYACDLGNGYAEFDTSNIEQQLIGNQTGLSIQYYDPNNTPLPSPLPLLFQNTEPFSQTISVKVEDATNHICYSETFFDLVVIELPEINLEEAYHICNLEPSITLNIDVGFNSYNWSFEDGTIISNTYNAEIAEEGSYILTVTQNQNGIACENSFEFNLIRSELPEIQQVNYGELGNNFIEIVASGDGNFEYSIDGINYQDNNYFPNIHGGCYTVLVRDKDGCGEDPETVTIIDYPKFFTPNNDGYNDYWQIKGIEKYPNSKIFIFDRYDKLLKKLSASSLGWDGTYNGKNMFSNDYWFKFNLSNGTVFKGHFSLKR